MNGSKEWPMPTKQHETHRFRIRNVKNWFIWSLLASSSSVAVMLFSFLLPAYQEQRDRYNSAEVIAKYESVGDKFFRDGHYVEAEQVFQKAFEFSESKRLDLEIKRLRSRIYKVYEQEDWVKTDFEEIEEGDFLFLIETTTNKHEKSDILGAYGIFKDLTGEKEEALKLLSESVSLNPHNTTSLLNLGNVYDELGNSEKSEQSYLKSLQINPESFEANYNLGALYYQRGDCTKTKIYIDKAKTIKPHASIPAMFSNCK